MDWIKTIISFIILIVLNILLSNSKWHSVLFNTYSGRLLLILFILSISYDNIFAGIVSVLAVVYYYQMTNKIVYERFTSPAPMQEPAIPVPEKKQTKSIEGFDFIGLEDVTRRGKQSNTLPVNTILQTSENVEPFVGFDGIYTAYNSP